MAKTADELLASMKRRILIPSSQPTFSDADILGSADDETQSYIVPLIRSMRQEFFVYASSRSTVANQAKYPIPYRAIGRTLRDLKLNDGSSTRDLALIALEDAHMFPTGQTPHGFYFEGDKYVLVTAPTSSNLTLLEWYDLQPSKLVLTSAAGLVVSMTTTTVTVSSVPAVLTSGAVIDFVTGRAGHAPKGLDKTIQSVSGTTFTFASGDVPTDLVAGDYISLSGTTPVVQLPDEAVHLLETAACREILMSLGDFEGANALDATEKDQEKNLKLLLEPRIEGENEIIINRRGLLRSPRSRFRRGVVF